jgi:phosphohistidine phosphatase
MTQEGGAVRKRGANRRFTSAAAAARSSDPEPRLELYLLRHADAGDSSIWTGDDAERPLSKKGRRQAKTLARTLKNLGLRLDAVISSPLLRAVQTAKPVAKATGVDLVTDERLGYGFDRRVLASLVRGLGAEVERVVLVGHDPGFSEVVAFLVGAEISMAKGALARIDLPAREVRAGSGDLRWLLPPDAVAR